MAPLRNFFSLTNFFRRCNMPDTGVLTFASITSDPAAGTSSWTNASNAATEDSNAAFYDAVSGASQILKCLNPNPSIPAGATIDGVKVEIKRKRASSGANMHDALVQLYVGGVLVGSNKADAATRWPTSFTFATYGGPSDTWGLTGGSALTAAQVNSSNFGIGIQGSIDSNSADDGQIDFVRMTIYYTAAAVAVGLVNGGLTRGLNRGLVS